MKSNRVRLIFIIIVVVVVAGVYFGYRRFYEPDTRTQLSVVYTIAGSTLGSRSPQFEDPFGIAAGSDGSVYVTDGETGKVWQIRSDGSGRVVSENLDTPSGVAIAPDGSLVIAETGAHVIRRIHPETGRTEVIAGAVGRAGFSDGNGTEAIFNGPIGVAIGSDGTVFVADTYNDRIRAIDTEGRVRTLAGSEPGFADAPVGTEARFDTPCGIAMSPNGALVIADTGNHRIRVIDNNGNVRTLAGTGERGHENSLLFTSTFDEPIGITIDKDGTVYVADSRGSMLRVCGWNLFPRVWTLAGDGGEGFQDGDITLARMNRPVGLALAADGSIVFTDNANKAVRRIGGMNRKHETRPESTALSAPIPTASEIRTSATPRWPFDPPDHSREIAATFGELRGELTASNKLAWFHNGLDIPGAYGETVRVVRPERILNPFSVAGVETQRERIRLPMLGYVHLRVGRDVSDRVFDESKFVVQRGTNGRILRLRVRRGTRFEAGEAIGTLNNQNHVHLTVGPSGNEFNAIAAIGLPNIKDTVAPTIEEDGVRLLDLSWREIRSDGKDDRINITGDIRIVVRAYDQMDGNAKRRRLGIYRLGYQVLASDGTSVPGFTEPRMTISFESLPRDEASAQLAYAEGSRSGASGETIFTYIVTNIVRDREVREGFLSTSTLAAGDYTIRVFAEDFFGNRTTRDTSVRIRNP